LAEEALAPQLAPTIDRSRTAGRPLTALSILEKALYGLGEAGEAVKNTALQTFLLFYYVQVVGLPGSLCGTALFLALFIDGVTDPLVGGWSDQFRSRWGKRHPFIYVAPIPLAICIFLLFEPPHGQSHIVLFAWLVTFNLLSRIAMTFYYVPHLALGADLSSDYHERMSVGVYRMLFTQVGRLLCLGGAFLIFFIPSAHDPNGQLNPQAYPPFALFCGIAVVITVLVSALGTQRRAIERQRTDRAPPPLRLPASGIWTNFFRSMSVPSFRSCFIGLLIMYVFAGTQGVLTLHMNIYFWGLTPQQAQYTFYAQIVGFTVGLPLARPMAHWLDKKWAYMLSVGSACVFISIPVFLRLAGWMAPNGDPIVLYSVTASNFAYGLLGANAGVFSAAMLMDAADDFDLRFGARAEGLFFGATSFSSKASNGIGGALAGIILDVIRFPRPPSPATPSAATIYQLGVAFGPVLLVLLLVGLSTMFGYDLTRAKHEQILAQLTARRAAAREMT
jgi:glycoside/pentoside/hexuronide:cation symporter, GPH family